MITSLNISSLYVLDQDAALDFYVGTLGLEVGSDLDLGFMRWLTVRVPGGEGREVLLERPGPPALDDATADQVRDLVTKGAVGTLFFTADDVRRTWDDLKAKGVELPEEPVERDYGIDFGFRDPFGNHIRIAQLPG